MTNKFCVYVHKDAFDVVRYIGKGLKNRPWNFKGSQRSKKWHEVFDSALPIVEIIERDLTEGEAFDLETRLIKEYRSNGNDLINISDGGFGGDSRNWSANARKMLSEMHKGEKAYWYGKKRDRATVEKGEQTKREKGTHTRYWAGKKRNPELRRF